MKGQEITSPYYNCKDLQKMLQVCESQAYNIIRTLNKELSDKGYLVIRGKVPKKYANERLGLEI